MVRLLALQVKFCIIKVRDIDAGPIPDDLKAYFLATRVPSL